jgi:hypothetical protein
MLEPNIDPKEIDTVISYCDKDTTVMLEYGCGGSTTIFPKHVKKYYSIEHNLDWFWVVQQEIYDDKLDNTEIHLCDIPKGVPTMREEFWDKYDENLLYAQENLSTNIPKLDDCVYPRDKYTWHEYIDFIDTLDIPKLDVVFIDGRARTDCAYKVLNYIDEDSIVFIHDFWPREEYHKVFDYYDEVVSVKDTFKPPGGHTLVGLKKK